MRRKAALALCALHLPLAAGAADARPYSLEIEFLPMEGAALEMLAGTPASAPSGDSVLVVGRMDHPGFYLEHEQGIALETPDGRRVPVRLDTTGLIREFGAIVSARVAFEIAEADIGGTAGRFRIVWGPTVDSPNILIPGLFIDRNQPGLYRRFEWRETLGAANGADAPFSSITIIADSTAEYHFLWYLVPMGLIFTILTLRKLRADHPSS